MDEEDFGDALIGQMGLMLTQLRYTRRALEDVERSTARYGGLAFSQAFSSEGRFGAPPLQDGALRVYIVNISDLSPASGWGGLFESLLGGVGRFLGGFLGGTIGGILGGFSLPFLLGKLERTVTSVERIIKALGLGGEKPVNQQVANAAGAAAEQPPSTLLDTLGAVTALLRAGAGQSTDQDGVAAKPPDPNWLGLAQGLHSVLVAVRQVVDGLTLFLPIAIGSLAALLARLDTMKTAVIDLLQFALRNTFLLLGVVLATLGETLSAAARLAGDVLGILGSAVERILTAGFSIVGNVLGLAVSGIRFVAGAISNTVGGLLKWALDAMFGTLVVLGESRLVRALIHAIRILPAMLPGLVRLVHDKPLADAAALTALSQQPIPEPTTSGLPSQYVPDMPNLGQLLLPAAEVATLTGAVDTAARGITSNVNVIFGETQGALSDLGRRSRAIGNTDVLATNERLRRSVQVMEGRAAGLARTLQPARDASAVASESPMARIATAYQDWLAGGGLRSLMGDLTTHLRQAPSEFPRDLVAQSQTMERPRATVEIGDLRIVIGQPPAPVQAAESGDASSQRDGGTGLLQQVLEVLHELQERGLQLGPGSALAQLTI